MKRHLQRYGPPAAVLLLVLLIHLPLFSSGAPDFPGDLGDCTRPLLDYARTAPAEWNPYLLAGRPGILDGTLYPPFYPASLLYRFLPGPAVFRVGYLAHLWLAGLGMFLFLRQLRITAWGAVAGAVVFAGSAFFSTRIFAGQFPHVASAAWTPWVFLTCHRVLTRRRAGDALGFGAAVAAQFLAGYPQFVYITAVGLGFLLLPLRRDPACREPLTWRHLAVLLSLAGAVCFTLTFHQLLPLGVLMENSNRAAGLPGEQAMVDSFNPLELVHFALPFAGRDPFTPEAMPTLSQFWEAAPYLGLLPLVLLAAALVNSLVRRRLPRRPFLYLALTALILSFGKYSLFYRVAAGIIPGFALMRVPGRFLLLAVFALAVLTAAAADRLRARLRRRRQLLVWLLPLLLAADLAVFAWQVVGRPFPAALNSGYWRETNPVVTWLHQQPAPYRVLTLKDTALLNESLRHRLENCGGYQGLIPRRYLDLVDAFDPRRPRGTALLFAAPVASGGNLAFLRLLDVKYLVTANECWAPESGSDTLSFPVAFRDGPVIVYENPLPRARAWLVRELAIVEGDSAVLAALLDPAFDPARKAVAAAGRDLPEPFAPPAGEVPAETVKLVSWEPGRLVLEAGSSAPAVLVVSELFYPGWIATLDGRPAPIFPVNHALLGLYLSPGPHQVTIRYVSAQTAVRQGVYLLGGLALAGYLFAYARRLEE